MLQIGAARASTARPAACLNLVDQSQQSGPADQSVQTGLFRKAGQELRQCVSGKESAAMGNIRNIISFFNIKACKPILIDPKSTNIMHKSNIIGAL